MNQQFERHLQIGRQFFAVSNSKRAAREFEAALALVPDDNYARLLLARCYLNLKRMKDARREAEIALQLDPNDADAHYISAYVAKNHKLALVAIDGALQLAPDRADYHGHRAFVLSQLGKYADALQSARRALEIAPDSAAAHRQIAGVLLDEAERVAMSRAKHQTATFHVARAMEIEPDNSLSQTALARLRGFDLEPEDALEKWGEALRLDPTDAYAQFHFRRAREQARMARFSVWVWRRLFRWMPWPLRLPSLLGALLVSFYWGTVVPPGNGWLSDNAFLSVLSLPLAMLFAMQLPLLLRDWLRFVPDRFLGAWFHPLKKPPLR